MNLINKLLILGLLVTIPFSTAQNFQDFPVGGGGGSGDVTSSANITDNAVVRGDGGAKGIQQSGVLIDDSNGMTGVGALTVDNLFLNDNTISSLTAGGLMFDALSNGGALTFSGITSGFSTTSTWASSTGIGLPNQFRHNLNISGATTGNTILSNYMAVDFDNTSNLSSPLSLVDAAAVVAAVNTESTGTMSASASILTNFDNNGASAVPQGYGVIIAVTGDGGAGSVTDFTALHLPNATVSGVTNTPVGLNIGSVYTNTIGGDLTVGNGLDLGASTNLSVNGTNILADSAGTMTLSNVDAVDSTTKATLQAIVSFTTQYIDGAAMKPSTTSGPAIADVETTTNKVNFDAYDFDAATDESAWFKATLPEGWDGTNIKVKFHWSDSATAGTGDVVWAIAALPVGESDVIDSAVLAAATVTDSFVTSGDLHTTLATADLTMTGHAAGDVVFFKVYRDADNGSDTYTQDARLLGLTIQVGESTNGAEW